MRGISIIVSLAVYLCMLTASAQLQPSSLFSQIEYNPAGHILRLTFRSGHIYEYYDVPRACYVKLIQTPTQGAYFNRHIRNRYDMRRLQPFTATPSSSDKQRARDIETIFSSVFLGEDGTP